MKLGLHGVLHTTEPEAAREFLRDKVGIDAYDSGGGWLIFQLGHAEVGVHPSDRAFHEISLSCDDLDAAMAEMSSRGVTFIGAVEEREWGRVATFDLPGGGPILLYQAKYGPA